MMVEEKLSEVEITSLDSNAIEEEVVHFGHPILADDNFHRVQGSIARLCQGEDFLGDEDKHRSLPHDVIEDLWSLHGDT